MHGNDPLHVAVLLSWREGPLAIIDSFLSCVFVSWGSSFEWICTSKYDGSGVSKYDGMRWIRRCVRISGNPMITSMQLSITLSVIPRKTLSDFVTSLKKVKSKTTVPYILLLNTVPARPTDAVSADFATRFPVVLLLQPLRYFPIDKRGISPSIE